MKKEYLIESLKDVITLLEKTPLEVANASYRNNPFREQVKVPGPSDSRKYIYITKTTAHEIEINIQLEDK